MNTTTHERAGKSRRNRRRAAASETTGGRLGVNPSLLDHDRFAYRWINDEPGRIEQKHMQDWDVVPQNGEKEDSTDLGSAISIVVGANPDGSPKRAYLCRKLKTYFDEDAKAAQEELDRQLEQLRRGRDRHGAGQGDYIPQSGITV